MNRPKLYPMARKAVASMAVFCFEGKANDAAIAKLNTLSDAAGEAMRKAHEARCALSDAAYDEVRTIFKF